MYRKIANVFGALGYLSLVVQWGWGIITLGTPLMGSEQVQNIFLPNGDSTPTEVAKVSLPEPIAVLFMVFAVVFAFSVTVYAIFAVPRAVGRTGQKATHSVAVKIVPHIVHQKKITKKRQKRMIEHITWSIKLILVLIPALALVIPVSPIINLDQSVVVGFGLFCAVATLLWFSLQYITAKIGKVDSSTIW